MFIALINKLKSDTHYRIKTFLLISLICNAVYTIFLFLVSKFYGSKWFFVMGIYYGLLSIARIVIFFQLQKLKRARKKLLIMRYCGCYLFLLNIVVSVMMFILIYTQSGVKHHEITVITIATYTFASLTLAIISGIKYLKKNDYIYTCIKTVRLVSASVSMVTLTNTMLTTFGEEDTTLRSIVLPLLSGAVSVFIILCAIFLIIKSNINLRIQVNGKKQK